MTARFQIETFMAARDCDRGNVDAQERIGAAPRRDRILQMARYRRRPVRLKGMVGRFCSGDPYATSTVFPRE